MVNINKINDYKNLEGFLEDLVNTTRNEIVQFQYCWWEGAIKTGGHSILACGSEKLEDGRVKKTTSTNYSFMNVGKYKRKNFFTNTYKGNNSTRSI